MIDRCSWGLQISQDALAQSKRLSWRNILTWSITAPFVYNLIMLGTVETGSWELIWYLQVSSCSAFEEWSWTLELLGIGHVCCHPVFHQNHQLHQNKIGLICGQSASQNAHLPNIHLLAGRTATALLPQFYSVLFIYKMLCDVEPSLSFSAPQFFSPKAVKQY